jgi:lipopolysaccharide transport system permease protein
MPPSEPSSDPRGPIPAPQAGGSVPAAEALDDADGWVGPEGPTPREVLDGWLALPGRLWGQRELVAIGVRRELATRFGGTLLGRLWPLLQPAALFGVYGFLFTRLLGVRMPDLPAGRESALGVYMFVGVLVWSGFAEGLSSAASSITDGGNLIRKIAFPSEVLPLQSVLADALTFLMALAAFILLCAVTPLWSLPGPGALAWIPLLLALQLALTYGLALAAATLQVFLRDTRHALAIALTLGMFFTPVFWVPSAQVLPGLEPWLPLVEASPLHHLLQAWRLVLMGGQPGALFTGSLTGSLARLAPWALGSLALGHALYTAARRRLADEV